MINFNPSNPGIANGNYFALPYDVEDSEIVFVSAPWDVTTSYGSGSSNGPKAIIEASLQVDLYDAMILNAWMTRIGTHPIDESLIRKSRKYRKIAEQIIKHLEEGGELSEVDERIAVVNSGSEELNEYICEICRGYLNAGKIPAVIGGDHSTPYGNIKALAEKYEDFGILHIDAHADLRAAYEGFKYSHASIMFNALNDFSQISQLTQVAVRDFCQDEADFINTDPRIRCFTDFELKRDLFEGKDWKKKCEEIIATLPKNVYISFDIDGLSPHLCPNTGTPVPGGLEFREADYLLWLLATSGKKIIGFDLCEVAPGGENEWDANVGARILYKLAVYTGFNHKKQQ